MSQVDVRSRSGMGSRAEWRRFRPVGSGWPSVSTSALGWTALGAGMGTRMEMADALRRFPPRDDSVPGPCRRLVHAAKVSSCIRVHHENRLGCGL